MRKSEKEEDAVHSDKEFVEKLRTIGFVQKFKPGATHRKPVKNEESGGLAGVHVEHHDGSQDAVAMPRVIEYKMGRSE
jgi:hypothetical protein